jgi:hypothetical protein
MNELLIALPPGDFAVLPLQILTPVGFGAALPPDQDSGHRHHQAR